METQNNALISEKILALTPADGTSVGNKTLREQVQSAVGFPVTEEAYYAAREPLIVSGVLSKGQGRGGSVRRVVAMSEQPLTLEAQVIPAGADKPQPKQAGLGLHTRKAPGVPTKQVRAGADGADVIAYRHDQKRRNNPDVGVVTPETDPEQPKTTWAYDPHIDPALQFDSSRARIESLIDEALASGDDASMRGALEILKQMAEPYLNWAGKAERTSFEVDTVSLHVHERIDPATILAAVRKRMQKGKGEFESTGDMFRAWFEDPLPYREAIEFYKHDRGWSNRLIAGDSLLVMNSLVQKEGMAGQVQMIYIDPPYGIKYGSNFQPFTNKRDVKDRKDEDLTQEPEMIKAFRDTWELGIHSYLTYLRDRLLLAKELLHESGSVFVQISDENLHYARNLLEEIFGAENFISQIAFKKTVYQETVYLANVYDHIVWFAKSKKFAKVRKLFDARLVDDTKSFDLAELPSGAVTRASSATGDVEFFRASDLTSKGESELGSKSYSFCTKAFSPKGGNHWKTHVSGLDRLTRAGRLISFGNTLCFRKKMSDYPVTPFFNVWSDTVQSTFSVENIYVVQTFSKVIERCLLMTTDPGDLVLDPTCGSGTAAVVAEKWGRRWITCDTSRVAVTLAKQRLMTASYDYFELKYPHEGLRGGFIYKTVPHVTLKSIANNPDIDEIWERMHPAITHSLEVLNRALGRKATASSFIVTGRPEDYAKQREELWLKEWEVPFDFPADWKSVALAPFDAFHGARQAMQQRMDASIAAHADQEILFDQPAVSKSKLRITGPFTVEAVPFPTVLSLDEVRQPKEADASIARSGESARQHQWRDELLKTGIRGKGGQMLKFAELEALPDTRHLHCTGHLDSGERVVVSFGPEHAALEQRQVELAMREAGDLFPRPKMMVFCAFAFDPEAAKDIDVTKGIIALKAQMNTDLLTDDLKKARSSNQSFWLMGQPDVDVRTLKGGKYQVEVNGFDYFDTAKGELVSGGKGKIAAWMLDTDYDERSLFPAQVFFPMAGAKDGWNKLKKNIKAELNEELLDKLHGTKSLPFEAGENRKIAVKIVDDRGIESLKVIELT